MKTEQQHPEKCPECGKELSIYEPVFPDEDLGWPVPVPDYILICFGCGKRQGVYDGEVKDLIKYEGDGEKSDKAGLPF